MRSEGEVDQTLELLRKKGFEHEAAVLARLEQTSGAAVRIPGEGDLLARVAQTAEAIKEGAPLIYQGAVTHGSWQGFPDFLVRKAEGAGFRFDPEDAKLARNAKGEYLLQLGIYAELLETMYGITVGGGTVHVAAGAPQAFDLRQTRYILKRLMRQFERFVAAETRITRPLPCSACPQCDFRARCEDEWRRADSPFFVAGLTGAQVAKLEQQGVQTLTALAELPSGAKIDGIGPDTLAKLSAQARLQLKARKEGKPFFEVLPPTRGRGFALLPAPNQGDIYFDMEGDPLAGEGLEYLFGLYGRFEGASAPEFRPVWAHNAQEEKAAFERVMRLFIEHLARHPGAHIYHYAHYEPHALKLLAMRYATMEAELDQILRERRFVDLYRVVVQGIRASSESYSLKDLEPLYGHAREADVKTAAASIIEYERWLVTGDASILEVIALYNKEDCLSTVALRNWLEMLRPSGVGYEIINELAEEKKERSAERAALEARKQALGACPCNVVLLDDEVRVRFTAFHEQDLSSVGH
jgi:predicted RecB family nuclease